MADAVAIFTPGQRLNGPDGVPLAGGRAEFFSAGTADPLTIYADADLTVSLGDTVYTDSAGYPVTAFGGTTKTLVFTGTAPYKIILYDASGTAYATHDFCVGAVVAGVGGGTSGITQAQADIRYMRNPNALTALSGIADADLMGFWDVAGSANKAITYANFKADLTTDFRADGRMFNVGTRMTFQQTTPPTGWTKETDAAYNDATLRFTTGTVATSGTASFDVVFTSRTPTGSNGGDTPTLGKTAAHDHEYASQNLVNVAAGAVQTLQSGTPSYNTSIKGSGAVHNHTFTGNAMDFDVKRVEMCIGVKA